MLRQIVIQHKLTILTFWAMFIMGLSGCGPPHNDRIIGVKIYEPPDSYTLLFEQWKELGINAAFSSPELLKSNDYRMHASGNHVKTFLIFPVFYNPEQLALHPEWQAITSTGLPAREEWVEFICPSDENYRKYIVDQAKEVIRSTDPDGISIDFIRHFVYWEKVYPDRDPSTLPFSCFNNCCIDAFQDDTGITLPDSLSTPVQVSGWILEQKSDEWIRWRCDLITSMVEEIVSASRKVKPGILVNIHLVPWAENDFNGALRRIAGQDIAALSVWADFLSPMTYAHMVKQEPEWVHSIVTDVFRQSQGSILPSIQVSRAYLEEELTPGEFRASLEAALEFPSSGVVFWSWERLAADQVRLEVIKKALTQ